MDSSRFWVFVFGEVEGLRWVLRHKVMAFPEHAVARVLRIGPGDRATLYTTRGAFHNPTRDLARLAGVVRVRGVPSERGLQIADREFTWQVPIEVEALLPERRGPEVGPLVQNLSVVKRPDVWGQYFRRSPVEVSSQDFGIMETAIAVWASRA